MEAETETPQCEPSYLGALFLSLCDWIIIRPLLWWHISPAISGTLWKSPPLFFADFAHGLHHEIPGLCGHHAAELSHRADKDYLRAGRRGWTEGVRLRREEMKEGSCYIQTRCHIDAMTFIFRFVWWHNHRCQFLEQQKIHITGFGFLSHHPFFSFALCGLLICKGRNWAKMRFNHKCKVASAATRLYSLVAYKP